ncbi:MAG: hypothetical protein WAM30_05990 [Candidatus Dormiibacterota bacterium]
MIGPRAGKAAFTWALFVILLAAGLLLVLRPGTPGFVITLFTLLIGLVMVGLVFLLVRLAGRS